MFSSREADLKQMVDARCSKWIAKGDKRCRFPGSPLVEKNDLEGSLHQD